MNPSMTNEQNAPAYEAQRILEGRMIHESTPPPPDLRDDANEVVYAYRQRFMGVSRLAGPIDEHVERLAAALSSPPAAGDAVAVRCVLRGALAYVGQRTDGETEELARRTETWMRESHSLLESIDVPRAIREQHASPAAPPSVTDAVRALVAKWRADIEACTLPTNCITCAARKADADELEALTHPGHKHAQEGES